MDDTAAPQGPRHAARTARSQRRPSRRALLLGSTAIVLGAGGGGVAAGVLRPLRPRRPAPNPPAALTAALGAEDELIAALDASMPARGSHRELLAQLRADHVAHRRAIDAAIRISTEGARSSTPTASRPAPVPRSRDELRAAEHRTAVTTAARAASLRGATATLLASIAACESSHADLLS